MGAPASTRGQGRTSGFPAVVLDFISKQAAMPGLLRLVWTTASACSSPLLPSSRYLLCSLWEVMRGAFIEKPHPLKTSVNCCCGQAPAQSEGLGSHQPLQEPTEGQEQTPGGSTGKLTPRPFAPCFFRGCQRWQSDSVSVCEGCGPLKCKLEGVHKKCLYSTSAVG